MRRYILFTTLIASAASLTLGGCASNASAPDGGHYKPAVNASSSHGLAKQEQDDQSSKGESSNGDDEHDYKGKLAAGVHSDPIKPHQFEKAEDKKGAKAVDDANEHSIRKPKSLNYLNSIMTYRYDEGAIYQVYTAPLQVTDVQFQPGEHIISIAAGDTLRWQVSKTYSGSGSNSREHLLIKPHHPDIKNSAVIMTNLRDYHLRLIATKDTYMSVVKWQYPKQSFVHHYKKRHKQNSPLKGLNLANMQFDYSLQVVKGSEPDWMPRMIFTDGNKTYIKFPVDMQEAPVLFLGEDSAQGHIVNYRVKGNYYVVDQVIDKAQLRLGQPAQTIVQISRVQQ